MERMNVACPVLPDAQELRMLRALVREGVAASRHGLYAVQFRGWRIRVWRCDTGSRNAMHIDIRFRDGRVWARFAWGVIGYLDGGVL
ncbi:hypothetical protein [Burkholderia cenocepacia]|uniref:hypothetical protein n=1 Tax=Burkholderia cenocepacia TaxID=95486 RepID=UPI00285BF5F6|nr:hypothetical protein [Burkholderia cenocepacia]MDR5645361.1 hypothetical protein [Burkholderia cenocepacia]